MILTASVALISDRRSARRLLCYTAPPWPNRSAPPAILRAKEEDLGARAACPG
jgi:hypothetical protein